MLGLRHQPLSLGSWPGDPDCPVRFQPAAALPRPCAHRRLSFWAPPPQPCCWHSGVVLPHSSLLWEFPFCAKWGWPLARVRGDSWPGWHAGWHRDSKHSDRTCRGAQGQSWGFGQWTTCPPQCAHRPACSPSPPPLRGIRPPVQRPLLPSPGFWAPGRGPCAGRERWQGPGPLSRAPCLQAPWDCGLPALLSACTLTSLLGTL